MNTQHDKKYIGTQDTYHLFILNSNVHCGNLIGLVVQQIRVYRLACDIFANIIMYYFVTILKFQIYIWTR